MRGEKGVKTMSLAKCKTILKVKCVPLQLQRLEWWIQNAESQKADFRVCARLVFLRKNGLRFVDIWCLLHEQVPSQPHQNLSYKNTGRQHVWRIESLLKVKKYVPGSQSGTYHFIKNISSPLESVAPIILSAFNPRANPRVFPVALTTFC